MNYEFHPAMWYSVLNIQSNGGSLTELQSDYYDKIRLRVELNFRDPNHA